MRRTPNHARRASFRFALMEPVPSDITQLLRAWSEGDRAALDRVVPALYEHLRRIAHQRLRGEDSGLTLDTTGLVHEAYLKLAEVRSPRFEDRSHFLAMASRVMRRVLVDHARAVRAAKRGGGVHAIELTESLGLTEPQADALIGLNDALERLETVDPRQSQIIELRYFGGLSLEETAESVGLSLATVKRELRFARAWLGVELGTEGSV